MTEQFYQHPGEVREARNFRCLHCNDIFTAPQGLDGHLSRVHNIDPRNLRYKEDWDVTTNVAGDYTPVENRQPSTYLGDRIMKSRMETTHNLECIVAGCGKVYSSSPGMSGHQQRKHNQGAVKDVNWQWTKDPVTINDLRSRAAQERKGITVGATAAAQPRTDIKAEESFNLKCLVSRCGWVVGSLPGMVGHLRRKHNQGARKSVNWERTKEPLAQEGRGRTPTPETPRTKRPYEKRQPGALQPSPLILSPDSKYIEIAAVIRVPISVGQAEIIQSGI